MVTVYESADKFGVIRAWACDNKAGCRVLKSLGEHPDWKFIFGRDVVVKKVSVVEYNKKAPSMDTMTLGQFNNLIHERNKTASEEVLRSKLEKLASENPELRDKLVPILKKEAGSSSKTIPLWKKTRSFPGTTLSLNYSAFIDLYSEGETVEFAVALVFLDVHSDEHGHAHFETIELLAKNFETEDQAKKFLIPIKTQI